ncbi:MAG: DUF4258 domain-containing protein [Candidatus Hydrothermarchaeota archaeon]|nr:MAG: DUF4258 domain-containing protein [Candidatus Hydrothermarchaeota archaeon]
MGEVDVTNVEAVLKQIRAQAAKEHIRITYHAHQEMVEEEITLDEVLEAIATGQILENYPEHRRGACCLLNGHTRDGRPLHIVCTTARPVLIIITVYEPKPPKWITPTQRGSQK